VDLAGVRSTWLAITVTDIDSDSDSDRDYYYYYGYVNQRMIDSTSCLQGARAYVNLSAESVSFLSLPL